MRPITAALFLIAVVAAIPVTAGASDQDKFEALVGKYAQQPGIGPGSKFRPKTACYCTIAPRLLGVVTYYPGPGGTFVAECNTLSFDGNGAIAGAGICNDFNMLGK